MLEPPQFIENTRYDGSRAFTWLADLCGLSVDLMNFILCQLTALFIAAFFRKILHPSKVSAAVRHTFALTLGLAFGYFCFGAQAIHIAGLPAACYVVIRTQNPAVVQRGVMIVAMIYLLCIHLMRQIYDYGSCVLDITGPLMIITQKVTSLAFSIHDGFVREQMELSKSQQYHAIQKMPTMLEYFSYVWHFQSIMAGPLVFYKDYIDFVEGCNLLKHPTGNANLDNGKSELIIEPSPMKAVIKKVIGSIVCAFIFMKFVKVYPVKNLQDDEFINGTNIFYKFWYVMLATTCVRFKYYHAWLLADAICNNSGLGFTGYEKDGQPKWDLISNINVLRFEFAPNLRDAINNWNCGTNRWLRSIVYERVPKRYGTLLTFTLSAVWHGFYPGYYLTFATGGLMVTSARVARRLFRHRFQATQFSRMFYDIITCITTRLVMGYTTFPFVLLEFNGSMKLYLKFYLCLHLGALLIVYVLPRFMRSEKRQLSAVASACVPPLQTKTAAVDDAQQCAVEATAGIELQNDADAAEPLTAAQEPQLHKKPVADYVPAVQHDQCEMEQLSNKLIEKIDAEAKNIEEFIDKTVTETVSGIVEFKKDLMRDSDQIFISADGLRKRNSGATLGANVVGMAEFVGGTATGKSGGDEAQAFLKKEIEVINAVVQQASVLPAVLSNGHAK